MGERGHFATDEAMAGRCHGCRSGAFDALPYEASWWCLEARFPTGFFEQGFCKSYACCEPPSKELKSLVYVI